MKIARGEFKAVFEEFTVTSTSRFEIIDITDKVEEVVSKSGISIGLCLVHLPHATAAIIANEYEPRIVDDYIKFAKDIFKPDHPWKHNIIDDNAHAHLGSAVIGSSRIFPVYNSKLIRGTWQNIMLLEMDGPRSRRVVVVVLGVGEA